MRKTIEEGNGSGAMMNTRSEMSLFDGRWILHVEDLFERYSPGAWLVLSSYLFSMIKMTTRGVVV